MGFFEKFKPDSSKIEKDNKTTNEAIENLESLAGYKKEESLDDLVPELNQSLKTKEVISGENPLEPDQQDKESLENILIKNSEDFQIINDNIDLIKKEIEHNNEKIRQLDLSILKTEEEHNSGNSAVTTSLERLKRMKNALESLNKQKEQDIEIYQSKVKNFYNLN